MTRSPGKTPTTDNELLRDIHSRTKRLETRLTAHMVRTGEMEDAVPPRFSAHHPTLINVGLVQAASPHVALSACIKVIPKTWQHDVEVQADGRTVAVLRGNSWR